jgi:hypothetical protein
MQTRKPPGAANKIKKHKRGKKKAPAMKEKEKQRNKKRSHINFPMHGNGLDPKVIKVDQGALKKARMLNADRGKEDGQGSSMLGFVRMGEKTEGAKLSQVSRGGG